MNKLELFQDLERGNYTNENLHEYFRKYFNETGDFYAHSVTQNKDSKPFAVHISYRYSISFKNLKRLVRKAEKIHLLNAHISNVQDATLIKFNIAW